MANSLILTTNEPAGATTGLIDVYSGRVSTLELADTSSVSSVRIVSGPSSGNLTVNPDNSVALVLTESGYTGSEKIEIEATYADGSTEIIQTALNVVQGPQQSGWGTGAFYMLETDAADDVVVETGDFHRKVHISKSATALTKADIAAREGLTEAQIDGQWLKNNPQYGADPSMALAPDAGLDLWWTITGINAPASSNWLLLERGYTYDYADVNQLITRGTKGEDPLHPIHVTAYGTGSDPVLTSQVKISQRPAENIVFTDLDLRGGLINFSGNNILLDDIHASDYGFVIQGVDGFTIRNSTIYDVIDKSPALGTIWSTLDKIQAFYVEGSDGFLFENNVVDHAAWADDYRYDLSIQGGQPPSTFSHNIYLQYDNTDVTVRDSMISRGASFAMQVRSGGVIEDNVFLDSNNQVNFLGGDHNGAGLVGNYTLFQDNIMTSAGHRDANQNIGALAGGAGNAGALSALIDNILAHQADPNNPAEKDAKQSDNWGISNVRPTIYDDSIIYNWQPSNPKPWATNREVNIDGLDRAVLDQTTIQIFTAQLLGQPVATIEDLLRHMETHPNPEQITADIIDFFQTNFQIDDPVRTTATTLRFAPDDRGDGIRWDNRLNWTTEDTPGTIAGDSVDLAGNWVRYGGNVEIDDLDFGSGGRLSANNGRLDVTGRTDVGDAGADLVLSEAGQVWLNGKTDKAGVDDALQIDVTGGRFANTGLAAGDLTINAAGGQTILASAGATMQLRAGDGLTVSGSRTKIGFDGTGGGDARLVLGAGSHLTFAADDFGFSTLGEFRSGAFGSAPDVWSRVDMNLGRLTIDLGGAQTLLGSFDLIDADALFGAFSQVDVQGLTASRDALILIDYVSDTVSLTLTSGTGQVQSVTASNTNLIQGSAVAESLVGLDDAADQILGLGGDDTLGGRSGDDTLNGGDGNDTLWGGAGNDTLEGGAGDDALGAFSGDDVLRGGAGNDLGWTGTGNDTVYGDTGNDTMMGAEGDDRLIGGADDDVIWGGFGHDTLEGGTGHDQLGSFRGNDQLDGGDGDDVLWGGDGNDQLQGGAGRDTLSGGAGNDTLDGGWNADLLTGGAGADTFVIAGVMQSQMQPGPQDTILDFSRAEGDVLDLSAIDANLGTPGNDSFAFAGQGTTNGRGTLAFDYQNGNTLVTADVDGGGADMAVLLTGQIALTASDFIL